MQALRAIAAIAMLPVAVSASAAVGGCIPGAAACPIDVEMARGTDTIVYSGVLVQNRDCCAYSLRVRAGQTLSWSESGAVVRTTIRYPNGDMDGPGLPAAIPLPQDGVYIFSVRPNLMADGAFGPFRVTFTVR